MDEEGKKKKKKKKKARAVTSGFKSPDPRSRSVKSLCVHMSCDIWSGYSKGTSVFCCSSEVLESDWAPCGVSDLFMPRKEKEQKAKDEDEDGEGQKEARERKPGVWQRHRCSPNLNSLGMACHLCSLALHCRSLQVIVTSVSRAIYIPGEGVSPSQIASSAGWTHQGALLD